MDAKELFFERYRGFQEYPAWLLEGLTERQVRQSPHPALNPIAWALWHIARCEDVGINRLLADRPQVLDDGGWPARLRLPERHIGTGMTKEQVARLAESVDLVELAAYREAVGARTVEVVGSLPSDGLRSELEPVRLRQVFALEGVGGPAADRLVEAYRGHTKGWLLGHIALTHSFYHIGQAMGVRALHGARNPL